MIRKSLGFIIGTILVCICLETTMRVGNFFFKISQDKNNHFSNFSEKNGKKTITILTLGESTTAVSANEEKTMLTQENAYPSFLETYLNEKNLPYHFKVINQGIMGGETGIILDRLENFLIKNKPDIIVAMMGMKDINCGSKTTKTKHFFSQLIEFFAENSRLVGYINTVYTQLKLKQSNRILQKEVRLFVDLSQDFIDNNQRIMGLDIGINSQLNPNMSERDVRDLAKQEFLAIYYFRTGQFDFANRIFSVLESRFKFGHILHSILLLELNDSNGAEIKLKEHLKLYPKSDYTYKSLISLYLNTNQTEKAKNTLKEASKFKLLDNLNLKIALSEFIKKDKKHNAGINSLEPHCGIRVRHDFKNESKKNIIVYSQKFVDNDVFLDCLYKLSEFYFNSNQFKKAEVNLERFTNNADSISGYNLLKKTYDQLGKSGQSEAMYYELISRNKRVGEYYALVDYYKNRNDQEDVLEIYNDIASSFPQTIKNFSKLYNLSKASKAKLILMQYPTFSIAPLKKLSGNLPDVLYVDNETIFNQGNRSDYFYEPHYPYNFNHYTKLGSQTIAKHLADQLEQVLK
jgi:lysophospholipase L1-like esterase